MIKMHSNPSMMAQRTGAYPRSHRRATFWSDRARQTYEIAEKRRQLSCCAEAHGRDITPYCWRHGDISGGEIEFVQHFLIDKAFLCRKAGGFFAPGATNKVATLYCKVKAQSELGIVATTKALVFFKLVGICKIDDNDDLQPTGSLAG
jgi:hypothetical protein